jgi:hypothetical protein
MEASPMEDPTNQLNDFTNQELLNKEEEEDAGLFGFFKKTLSSVKKTFENTFKKPASRNTNRSKTPYEESPDIQGSKSK